jgi:hypothetical protein
VHLGYLERKNFVAHRALGEVGGASRGVIRWGRDLCRASRGVIRWGYAGERLCRGLRGGWKPGRDFVGECHVIFYVLACDI